MKGSLIAQLEAWAALHRSGYRPTRTLAMGIGHDEEVGGGFGAKQIAARVEQLGLKLALVWDEGMTVLSDGAGKLLPAPVACVGVAEKARVATPVQCGHVCVMLSLRVTATACFRSG